MVYAVCDGSCRAAELVVVARVTRGHVTKGILPSLVVCRQALLRTLNRDLKKNRATNEDIDLSGALGSYSVHQGICPILLSFLLLSISRDSDQTSKLRYIKSSPNAIHTPPFLCPIISPEKAITQHSASKCHLLSRPHTAE